MEKKVVIEGKDLSIGYRTGKQEKIVHRQLNFELHAGELTCLWPFGCQRCREIDVATYPFGLATGIGR